MLNKLYCRDAGLRKLMRPIVERCFSSNIHLFATHIPGNLNKGPDLLSRGKETEFLACFPHMDQKPLDIPHRLGPMCGLIERKDGHA